jgi:hypothetical protein
MAFEDGGRAISPAVWFPVHALRKTIV